MSLLEQLLIAWLIGFPAIVLAGNVDERFIALCGVSGLLLIAGAIRALTNDRDWERFLASQRRGRFGYPRGRLPRLWFGLGVSVIGAGFALAGVLGLLAVFGLYELPGQ
jgi:hypothetical protein